MLIWKSICTPMLIAALFIVAKTWKCSKCSSIEEGINKIQGVCMCMRTCVCVFPTLLSFVNIQDLLICKERQFYFFLSNVMLSVSFSCLIALSRACSVTLTRSDMSRRLVLFLILGRKHCLSPSTVMFSCGFSVDSLYQCEDFPFYSQTIEHFYPEKLLGLVNAFSASVETIMPFFFFIICPLSIVMSLIVWPVTVFPMRTQQRASCWNIST